jgi:serine/threonine protein phosphatase PrpC
MSPDADPSPPEGNGTLRAGGVLAKLSWALHSVPGDVRPHNEDFAGAYAPTIPDDAWDRPPVFVVADGLRGDECSQLTTDHSRAAEMVRMKLITPEQAATHPARSMLTRSLGAEPTVQVDLARNDLRREDTFVLCSDGLWDVVGRADLLAICQALGSPAASTPADAAAALVDLALKRGTADNVTALVVRVKSDRPIPGAGARRSFFRRR